VEERMEQTAKVKLSYNFCQICIVFGREKRKRTFLPQIHPSDLLVNICLSITAMDVNSEPSNCICMIELCFGLRIKVKEDFSTLGISLLLVDT
jgi:hypothetical protein